MYRYLRITSSRLLSTSNHKGGQYCGAEIEKQSGEKQGRENARTPCNQRNPIKCNAPRSKEEAGILKTFALKMKGHPGKNSKESKKASENEIVASSCVSKAARRGKQINRENDRARQKLGQAPR
jgi:hypothetical protein